MDRSDESWLSQSYSKADCFGMETFISWCWCQRVHLLSQGQASLEYLIEDMTWVLMPEDSPLVPRTGQYCILNWRYDLSLNARGFTSCSQDRPVLNIELKTSLEYRCQRVYLLSPGQASLKYWIEDMTWVLMPEDSPLPRTGTWLPESININNT